jgi:hypothetical protein
MLYGYYIGCVVYVYYIWDIVYGYSIVCTFIPAIILSVFLLYY